MYADADISEEPFECTWRIQNFSLSPHQQDEYFNSPIFSVNGTEWRLSFYPRGDMDEKCMSCYLFRMSTDGGPDKLQVQYEISILSANGHDPPFSKRVKSRVFGKGSGFGSKKFAERDRILSRRDLYLPGDVLTLRCRLKMMNATFGAELGRDVVSYLCGRTSGDRTKETEDLYALVGKGMTDMKLRLGFRADRCAIRTRIGVEYRRFTWPVGTCASWKPNRKLSVTVASSSEGSLPLLLSFHVDDDDAIRLQVCIASVVPVNLCVAARCELSILDRNEHALLCDRDEHLFQTSAADHVWHLPTPGNRSELDDGGPDLRKDLLSFRFHFTMSSGTDSSWFEGSTSDSPALKSEERHSTSFLRDDLHSIYTDRKFCDLTLQVRGQTFDAHRAVVCARSPYLRAMLETDMKEKASVVLDLQDVDPCTVDRMLTFFYTDVVEDQLPWEDVAKLFTCAVRWQVEPLKSTCSSLLRQGLSVDNVLVVLELACQHCHSGLKNAAMNYIYARARVVLQSDEWKDFVEQYPRLALETFSFITNAMFES